MPVGRRSQVNYICKWVAFYSTAWDPGCVVFSQRHFGREHAGFVVTVKNSSVTQENRLYEQLTKRNHGDATRRWVRVSRFIVTLCFSLKRGSWRDWPWPEVVAVEVHEWNSHTLASALSYEHVSCDSIMKIAMNPISFRYAGRIYGEVAFVIVKLS